MAPLVESLPGRSIFEGWLGSINFRAGTDLYKEGKFKEAIPYLRSASEQYSSNSCLCRKLAISYIRSMQYSSAVSVLKDLDRKDCMDVDKALLLYAQAMHNLREERAELLEKAHRVWPEYELEILGDCFHHLTQYYINREMKQQMDKLFEMYPRTLEFPSDRRGIVFHATLISDACGFALDEIKDKKIGAVYFDTLFRHFKAKGQVANASRCLYGKFLYDGDEQHFRDKYKTLGDHLIPADKAVVVLQRFFDDE